MTHLESTGDWENTAVEETLGTTLEGNEISFEWVLPYQTARKRTMQDSFS